jgi:hypothetical protein
MGFSVYCLLSREAIGEMRNWNLKLGLEILHPWLGVVEMHLLVSSDACALFGGETV